MYEYTKPRKPIAAMYNSPGPCVYGLPTLVGREKHDPRSVHSKVGSAFVKIVNIIVFVSNIEKKTVGFLDIPIDRTVIYSNTCSLYGNQDKWPKPFSDIEASTKPAIQWG